MSMRPNFNSPLHLDDGGKKVKATGPLNWNGTTGHCKVHVVIWQNGITATGDSSGYDDSQANWDADGKTQNSATLSPGPATATGTVTLENSNDPPPPPWTQPVQLQ